MDSIRFGGPLHIISSYQSTFRGNQHKWNAELTVLQNIQGIFNIKLPKYTAVANNDSEEEVEMELLCCICYSYLLSTVTTNSGVSAPSYSNVNTIPSEQCTNSKCSRKFHKQCLLTYLLTLIPKNARRSVGRIYGHCPYCQDHISIREY